MKNTEKFKEKYKSLNTKQKEAVDTIEGPVMVVAGPGTGKTTVLTLRIANILLKTDTRPEQILALSFTENGVRAMREKLREIIGDVSFRVNLFTFHGFANHMRALYPENFTKIGGRLPSGDVDGVEIIEEILKNESFRELRPSTFGVKIGDIVKRIGELKKEAIAPDDLIELIEKEKRAHKAYVKSLEKPNKTEESQIEKKEKYLLRMEEFEKTYRKYEGQLEKREIYDYDDTILGLIDALKKNPDLQAEMRESFQYILADEHQDANGAQNEILKFFRGLELDAQDAPNLFVVGDDKQSIFRFQGASLENFYNFKIDFKGAKKIDLTENYRSHSHILDVTHHLITHDNRTHTKLSSNVSYPVRPIEINEYLSMEDEMSGTVEKIKKSLEENAKDTVAVIARTNSALHELGRYLEKEKIDYSLAGEKSLFETDAFLRLSNLFGALIDPLTDAKFISTMYFGYFKINLHDILAIENFAKKMRLPFASVLLKGDFDGLSLHEPEALQILSMEIKRLIADAKKLPLLLFIKALTPKIFDANEKESLDVLRELFSEADKLVLKKRNARLSDFVDHLSLLQRHNLAPSVASREKKSRVELLSIHRAKGLEYDHVYILDVTDKKFEKMGKKADLLQIPGGEANRDLEENRRLLYVAITRAKKHATLSYALAGQSGAPQAPSALLDELLPSLVKKEVKGEGVKKISLFEISEKMQRKASSDLKKELQEEFLRRSFSVTALNNYLACPWKYFFRNLLQIPDVSGFSAMLGTACHEALRVYHHLVKKGKLVKEGELQRIMESAVTAQAFSKGELPVAMAKAEEAVGAYVKSFVSFGEDEKTFIEEKISFPFVVLKEKAFEILITGALDLVVEEGSRAHVKDFKTKKRMTRNEIMGKTKNEDGGFFRQLQFYKFLWENAGFGSTVTRASLVFLSPERGNISTETFDLTDEDKNQIEEMVSKSLQEIYALDFWDKTCGEKDCEFCRLSSIFKERANI